MNKQTRREYIAERIDMALGAIENSREIRRAVTIRARMEGRTYMEQALRSAMEATAADLKHEGWKVKDVHDSATWQPPAGTNFLDN